MSKYDPVLGKYYLKEVKDNQRYLSPKSKMVSFISWETTCRKIYWKEFEKPIFAIILDSTPDISNTDQINFICRYVIVEVKEAEVGGIISCFYHLVWEDRLWY